MTNSNLDRVSAVFRIAVDLLIRQTPSLTKRQIATKSNVDYQAFLRVYNEATQNPSADLFDAVFNAFPELRDIYTKALSEHDENALPMTNEEVQEKIKELERKIDSFMNDERKALMSIIANLSSSIGKH